MPTTEAVFAITAVILEAWVGAIGSRQFERIRSLINIIRKTRPCCAPVRAVLLNYLSK